jgi:hypothetical protein
LLLLLLLLLLFLFKVVACFWVNMCPGAWRP